MGGGEEEEEKVVGEREEEEEEEVWKSTRSTFHGRLIEQMGRTNVMCTVPPLLTQPPPIKNMAHAANENTATAKPCVIY